MSNLASHRTVASCMVNGSTQIPLRRSLSRTSSNGSGFGNGTAHVANGGEMNGNNRWKSKYEESEVKRKALIAQNEKSMRSYNDLEKKNIGLQTKLEEIETELFEKNESLAKVTTASRQLFQEYETLKSRYESETGAMHRALNDASQWYRENKVLRRRTMMLDKDTVDEGVDACESGGDADLENLKESVKQLSSEVGHLQSELSATKLLEFETSEQNANLIQELDAEKDRTGKLEAEVQELRKQNEQLIRVSGMMKRELEEMKQVGENQRNSVFNLRKEADSYKRERNVLKHQSALLLEGLDPDDNESSIRLLLEIEDLKRTVEDERNKYNLEIAILQEKLEEQENNSQAEILEERLKLVESELQEALERAEKAERKLAVPPPAPPLPPPPPPAPPAFDAPPCAPVRVKKLSRTLSNVPDIAAALGVQETQTQTGDSKKAVVGGVNDDIINQIKGGMFTLRRAKNESKKQKETPKAVSELLNVLGSLRRAPKNRVSLQNVSSFGDVQL